MITTQNVKKFFALNWPLFLAIILLYFLLSKLKF